MVLTSETGDVRGAHVLHATTEDEHRPRFSVLSVFALTENSETWRECCAALPLAVVGGVDAAERPRCGASTSTARTSS